MEIVIEGSVKPHKTTLNSPNTFFLGRLAELIVSSDSLRIKALAGEWRLSPEEVSAIRLHDKTILEHILHPFSDAIEIKNVAKGYPASFFFFSRQSSKDVLAKISNVGFRPQADEGCLSCGQKLSGNSCEKCGWSYTEA